MIAAAAKGAAVALIGALVGAAAIWWAYPRVHRHVQDHFTVRTRAILSQAQQGRFDTVILGDSLVELSYLPQLCGAPALNAGLGGATIAEVASLAAEVLPVTHPRRVIVAAGVNNAGADALTDPKSFRATYAGLIQNARAQGARVYVATIAPVAPGGPLGAAYFHQDRINEFNAVIAGLGTPVISLAGLANQAGQLPQADTSDGVHLVPAAYGPWNAAMSRICAD
jgi:lysophospholipase L1-like esterase